jgi:hypothetical protein
MFEEASGLKDIDRKKSAKRARKDVSGKQEAPSDEKQNPRKN